MTDTDYGSDRRITARRMPTPAEIGAKLGVPPDSLSPLRPAHDGSGATIDAVLDGRLQRVAVVLDDAASWPPEPGGRLSPFRRFRLPDKYRLERERRAVAAADASRRAEVERRHFAALDHLAREAVTAAAVTGCTPAWVVGARAIDEARAARGQSGPVTALTASALGLDDVRPPTWQRQGKCRVCSTTTSGGSLCTPCVEREGGR